MASSEDARHSAAWAGYTEQAMPAGIVTASTLNVRTGPSVQEARIGTLPRATKVEVFEPFGSWYRIRSGDLDGFVHGDFIRLLEDDPVSGALKEHDSLLTVALEPPPSLLLTPADSAASRERLVARTWNQQGGLLAPVSRMVDIEPAAAIAVVCVESGGRAFSSDGRMIIRFENHVFLRQWGTENEAKFRLHFRFNPDRRWTGHEFRTKPNGKWHPFHGNQKLEWEVFLFARSLDPMAAMRSISMGAAQIMGFNFAKVGYDSVAGMFESFQSGLRHQLLGFFDFVKGPGSTSAMLQALQRKSFAGFATLYNGPGQAAEYGERIQQDFESFTRLAAATGRF
jgi:hypothetical protein